jgi:poly-beta-1,6-N-acetyl-D-glucosamine synthase
VSKLPSYVLITPARNEARLIEQTIQSVVRQTVLPLKWVIVSDGSTDGTDEIVKRYAAEHAWMELLRLPERRERNFAGKAHAFNLGKARMEDLPYEVIANLDADITFESDYFAFLLEKLTTDPRLGVIGTPYVETNNAIYDYRYVSLEHVSGACQVFRRACYEAIGGYVPVKVGTIDCIAVITARMKDWKTRTFPEKVCYHHRLVGTATASPARSRFVAGVMDYTMGNHPLWQFFRTLYQMGQKPYLVRGMVIGAGYVWSWLRGAERPVSPELIRFHRREQMQRLRAALRARILPVKGRAAERKIPEAGTRAEVARS